MSRLIFKVLFIFLFCFSVVSLADEAKQNRQQEIQIVIDVSGSMKQSDPRNLRVSALKLLINLMPEGTKAGISLFAHENRKLIQFGVVDESWKSRALAQLQQIHSRGLYTDIEKAIEQAIQPWSGDSDQSSRHIILLTDGMVDVSKDFMQSAESRDRIIAELIPRLQQQNIKIQAIALSDQVDSELMGKLAFDTNGWSESASSAEQLQKVFFNMFKKAVPQDTVPLTGNQFVVDSSINEFSLVVFKQSGKQNTQLKLPDGKLINHASKDDKVAWLTEPNYDLITVNQPLPGNWEILADIDPENQVMIVTDLKFQVDPIANYFTENETIVVTGYFSSDEQLVSEADFLNMIDLKIELLSEDLKSLQWTMQPVIDKPGLFQQKLSNVNASGKYKLSVLADGKTFQRSFQQEIEILEKLFTVEKEIQGETLLIKLTADKTKLNTDMVNIQATVKEGLASPIPISLDKTENIWQAQVDISESALDKWLNFSVMAETIDGKSISPNIAAIEINQGLVEKFVTEKKEETENLTLGQEQDNLDDQDAISESDVPEDEDEIEEVESSWVMTSIMVLVINIILFSVGFFIYKSIKKSAAAKQAELLNRLVT